MEVIHLIGGYANKVQIEKYSKGRKYPEVEVGKYVYAIREGKYREGRKYVRI